MEVLSLTISNRQYGSLIAIVSSMESGVPGQHGGFWPLRTEFDPWLSNTSLGSSPALEKLVPIVMVQVPDQSAHGQHRADNEESMDGEPAEPEEHDG